MRNSRALDFPCEQREETQIEREVEHTEEATVFVPWDWGGGLEYYLASFVCAIQQNRKRNTALGFVEPQKKVEAQKSSCR